MFKKFLKTLALALYTSASGLAVAHPAASDGLARIDAPTVARQVEVGDIVFIRVPSLLFRKVADANGSWTNHVGIVNQHRHGRSRSRGEPFPALRRDLPVSLRRAF